MIKKILLTGLITISLVSLSACSWETYTKKDGTKGLHRTTPTGSAVYYEDGTYSQNQRYNQHRPVRHVIPRSDLHSQEEEIRGTHWEKPEFQN